VGTLTWWLSRHPDWREGEDWPEEVPVVRYDTEDEVVLIDPFLPPDGAFDPGTKPVRVLLTQRSHYRGTGEIVDRYGASVWMPPGSERDLPEEVQAIELDGEPRQVVFYIGEHRLLVSGDVLTGRDGVMHVFVDEAEREPLLASLERLADLPIERVIVPHCETPEFLDGAAHIRAAVAEARAAL
jgi:glyoxylase-like metal-dependent hydrolase (beta-lactamase superfamily II)